MSSTTCAQPGCTGAILDGYCDVCGAPAPPASGSAAGPSTGAEAAKCSQPGCPGTVLDGYCDVCGSPAAQGSPTASASLATMPAGVAQTPSTVSRASNRLASTALGSARASVAGSRDHAAHRHVVDTASWRAARCGSDLDPPVAAVDAAKALMKNPMVPEERRTCPSCGSPVGRSWKASPGGRRASARPVAIRSRSRPS